MVNSQDVEVDVHDMEVMGTTVVDVEQDEE